MHMYKAENNFYGGEGIVGDQVSLRPCLVFASCPSFTHSSDTDLLLCLCTVATLLPRDALRQACCQPVLMPACNHPALYSRS